MHITDERFADIQMLRYELKDFHQLSLQQKLYIYYLSEATLWGRDITFDQNCRFNLDVRRTLEAVSRHFAPNADPKERQALLTYLKQVWFASGIHHHYGCEKFTPHFSTAFFHQCLQQVPQQKLPLGRNEDYPTFAARMERIIFDADFLPKRVNLAEGVDLVKTSACNFYQGVTQDEAEAFYQSKRAVFAATAADNDKDGQPSWGLNSTLVRHGNDIKEEVWHSNGKYGDIIRHITDNLRKARLYAENERQQHLIDLLAAYYESGDLALFDEYSIAWTQNKEGTIDFINGFIEVYGDPLGIKGTWEGIVHYVDSDATRRTKVISDNAQWFEDHSPVSPRFKKAQVTGVSANVVRAAMLGGEEYPATAIGINLPNADWIRAEYGSKSISISNIVEAYNIAAHGNGFYEEFVPDEGVRRWIEQYGDMCDMLHTDLHECVGHGSGRLLPDVDVNALKAYGSCIEEARADLFGLYYMADKKMLELNLLPHAEAYKSHYYTYMLNGLMTQLVRIKPGHVIEEAHMRNRALIARWIMEHSDGQVALEKADGKTALRIADYSVVRRLVGELLAEVQRIKSEGDYDAARQLVETYGIRVEPQLHREMIARYETLNIAPYKGFINPRLTLHTAADGTIDDVLVDYTEDYSAQMLRYSEDYSLPHI